MQNRILTLGLVLVMTACTQLSAQYTKQDTIYKKYFIGSSFFMLGNLLPENPPDFVQLNLGYRITGKDAVSLEVKTWRYFESLGIPWGSAKVDPVEKFPGFIREVGFALAYQRFLWKGLYASVHVMSAWQSFIDKDLGKIDTGFQIFNTYRLGYHIKLFKNRFFLEPGIAITHRPYTTEMPESFEVKNEQWPNYFLWEPGLHFGFNF